MGENGAREAGDSSAAHPTAGEEIGPRDDLCGCQMFNLRGPTPFEEMIFYIRTDSNEICTEYVKLKINHILFLKNF